MSYISEQPAISGPQPMALDGLFTLIGSVVTRVVALMYQADDADYCTSEQDECYSTASRAGFPS